MKKLFLLLSIFTLVNSVEALDRNGIREQIRYLVLDTTESVTQRWSDSVLNNRIELAQIDIVKNSRCLTDTQFYDTYVNTRTYALPGDLFSIERVAYWVRGTSDVYKKLERYSPLGLDTWNNLWQQIATGLPERYYIWGSSIGLVPAVSSVYYGSKKLQIDYVMKPTALSNDSSVPFNGRYNLYPYHILVIWYVVALCKMDERSFSEAQSYEQRYYNGLTMMIKELKITSNADFNPDFNVNLK